MVDETEVLETSTDTQEADVTAPSSSVESETEADLLAVVQDAMQITEEPDSQSDEQVTEEVVEAAPIEDEPSEPEDDETFNDVPFHEHPRFKKLITERNAYKEDATQYGKITGFLDQNNVTAEEAAQGLQIMALMKQDPAKALEALQPYVRSLSEVTGATMPDDIQARVNDGYLDEDAGKELARSRGEVARERQMREQMEQRQFQQEQAQSVGQVVSAVTDWETRTRQSDPDYELKQDEMDDRVKVLVAEKGRPQSADAALAMARQAYDEVNARYSQKFANKRPIKTASGGKLSGTPTPEPQSLMEAVQSALAQGS
jgi:hypothetical protein